MSESNEDVVEEERQEEKSEEEIEKEKVKKEEKNSRADELWRAIQADKERTTRVASILNRYSETRNSDFTLQMQYWRVYNDMNSDTVDLKKLFTLERLTSIVKQELGDNFKLHYEDQLVMDQLIPMEAHKSIFLKFADSQQRLIGNITIQVLTIKTNLGYTKILSFCGNSNFNIIIRLHLRSLFHPFQYP